ncbi:facilitated trehalose transporter Tret1-like [Bombyx mori]|uniref:facilitated trehalose transporter Tret1-like n=1 Tax=Bombyx mori TaxID=7091 RepID=UPI002ED13AF8
MVCIFLPESPSFLVSKGRYDECRKVFHWLRSADENEELEKMIKSHTMAKTTKEDHERQLSKLIWDKSCSSCLRVVTTITDAHTFKVITSLDVLRLVAALLSVYIFSRMKRRSVLLTFVSLNIFVNLCVSCYIYTRRRGLLPFDHMAIGILLLHCLYFVVGAGVMPLMATVSGEIFPLADRGFCLVVNKMFSSLFMFGDIKSAPYLVSLMGVEGTFFLYALILFYGLIVAFVMLPETKDKTLQEVEDEIRGYSIYGDSEETFAMKSSEVNSDEN